jgi:hypothetical protein
VGEQKFRLPRDFHWNEISSLKKEKKERRTERKRKWKLLE